MEDAASGTWNFSSMRSLPKGPLNQALWLVCLVAVLVMIFASTIAGLAVMVAALVLWAIARVAGV